MKITLITINYNNSRATIKLLESLKANEDQNFGVIAVDNASTAEEVLNLKNWVLNEYDKVQIIKSERNLGFSGGNNVGLSIAFETGSDWAFLINNDTTADKAFISELKANLSQSTGLIGFPMMEGEKTAFSGKVRRFRPTLPHRYKPLSKRQKRKDYIIGGAIAISKEAYQKIGGLDEKYFLYFEDVDYTLKARKNKIKVDFEEMPKLFHAIQGTTKNLGSPLLLRYHYRNAMYFSTKYGFFLFSFIWGLIVIAKQLIKIITFIDYDESSQIMAGVLDFWAGRMGEIKVIPKQ